MVKLRRDKKIFLHETNKNQFAILDEENNTLVDADSDYFIYFRNVNFMPNGIIRGRYLGENPTSLIDEHCKPVKYTDKGWKFEKGSKIIKTARMVAVRNKDATIIVIEND
jgi:hypothetical protein